MNDENIIVALENILAVLEKMDSRVEEIARQLSCSGGKDEWTVSDNLDAIRSEARA